MLKSELLNSDLVEVVLGYYDFEKFVVNLGFHKDTSSIPVSLEHERLHQRLNQHTSFGLLIRGVAQQVKQHRNRQDRKLLNTLVNHCKVVHEMLATYGSIVGFHRFDLVASLPDIYKDCFNGMQQMVSLLPSTQRWRIAGAWNLCRIAMLTKTYKNMEDLLNGTLGDLSVNTLSNDLIPDSRLKTIIGVMQRFKFSQFEERLYEWGASPEFLDLIQTVEDEDEILKKLEGKFETPRQVNDHFDFVVMHAFLDMFQDVFPDLEEVHRDCNMATMIQSMARNDFGNNPRQAKQIDLKLMDYLLEQCNQRIQVNPVTIQPRLFQDSQDVLSDMVHKSLSKLNVLYPFCYHEDENNVYIHLTNVTTIGHVDHYALTETERNSLFGTRFSWTSLFKAKVSALCIYEMIEYKRLWVLGIPENRLDLAMFVHIGKNPIDVLNFWIYTLGIRVEFAVFRLGYQYIGPDQKYGIQLCIYWIDKYRWPFFHLSNEMMTNAISSYCESIGNEQIIQQLSVDEATTKVPNATLSKLVDHPVFNYYLTGTRGSEAVLNRSQTQS